jgi:hypothetical protein
LPLDHGATALEAMIGCQVLPTVDSLLGILGRGIWHAMRIFPQNIKYVAITRYCTIVFEKKRIFLEYWIHMVPWMEAKCTIFPSVKEVLMLK